VFVVAEFSQGFLWVSLLLLQVHVETVQTRDAHLEATEEVSSLAHR